MATFKEDVVVNDEEPEQLSETIDQQAAQLKHLRKENSNLRDAILKVRDAFSQATKELEDTKKELEDVQYERDELALTCEAQAIELEKANHTIDDFREQVDAAEDAEKMVTSLTDKNLALEERIRNLEKEIQSLDEIKVMDEEIIESQKEMERDLKESNDRSGIVIADLKRQLFDFDKCAKDYEHIIAQYRQKNAELNEQIQQLKDEILIMKSQEESQLDGQGQDESQSLRFVAANRAFSEIVDSEVRMVELEFTRQHNVYLKSFLPDNFTKPGGDNDCVLLCTFFPRLAAKADVLAKLLNMKYPLVPGGIRHEHITLSHKAEQWAHVRKFAYSLSTLRAIAKKFEFVLKNCSVERLTRLAVQQLEITGQEKNLDMYFELLRQNRLDENTSVDNVDRIVIFLQKIYTTNMTSEAPNAKENLCSTIDQLREGLVWNHLNCERFSHFLQAAERESSEFGRFVADFLALVVESEGLIIRAQNRIPAENDLIINADMNEKIMNAVTALQRSTKLIHNACAFAASQLTTTDVDGFSSVQMKEMLHSAVEKFMGAIDGHSAAGVVIENIKSVKTFLFEISELLENSSIEIPPTTKNKFPPLLERAHMRKNDIVEAESLRWQLSKKDEEIVKLQKVVKLREGDISTYKVRLELADKQINSSDRSSDSQTERLRSRCGELEEDFLRQKKDHEGKITALKMRLKQTIEELERERERNSDLTKNSLMQDVHQSLLNSSIASLNSSVVGAAADGPASRTEAEVRRLQKELLKALNDLKLAERRISLLETKGSKSLAAGSPIDASAMVMGKSDEDAELEKMIQEVDALIQESNGCLIEPVDARERVHFKMKVARVNERIDMLKFRFHRFWHQTRPGEPLPQLVDDLIKRRPKVSVPATTPTRTAKPQQRCWMILDKWSADLQTNSAKFVGRATTAKIA